MALRRHAVMISKVAYLSMRYPHRQIKVTSCNPGNVVVNPIPWTVSLAVLGIGIASWITGALLQIVGLEEAARAMVYLPLGNIFGLSTSLSTKMVSRKKHTEHVEKDKVEVL